MFKIIKTLCMVSAVHLSSAFLLVSHAADEPLFDAHKLELSISVGEMQMTADASQSSDEHAKQIGMNYNYSLNSGLYFGFGLIAGASGSLSIVDNIFDGDEFEYQALALIGGFRVKTSNRHSLFAQMGLLDYDANSMTGNTVHESRGHGWALSSGWEYRFTQRFIL